MAAKKRAKRKKPRCKGKTKAGKRCRNGAAVDGLCMAHVPRKVKEERGFGGPQEGSGRPRKPRPDDILRERIEADIDRWLAPLEAALGEGKPIKTWDGKQHKIVYALDPKLGMTAMKLAFERVYGRPRQQVELSGADGGAVKTEIEFSDPKVQEALHGLVCAVADTRES